MNASIELRHFRELVNEIIKENDVERDIAESRAYDLLYKGKK